MLELAGQLADGWIPFAHTPESYQKSLGKIKESARAANRPFSDFEPACIIPTVVSNYAQEAERLALKWGKICLSWSVDNMKLIVPGMGHPDVRQLYLKQKKYLETLNALAGRLPDAAAVKMGIWGKPDACINRIEEFLHAGCKGSRFFVFFRFVFLSIGRSSSLRTLI